MPPEAEVHGTGATLETGFTLTLQSESYSDATGANTMTDMRPSPMIARPSPLDRDPESPQPSARRHWALQREQAIEKATALAMAEMEKLDNPE